VPVNEASEFLALTLIFVVHVAGGLMLVWGMLDGDAGRGWRPRWWRRGGGPDGPPIQPPPASPPSARTPLPLPLPDAVPSRVRLRDETPLREGYPRPPRRPPAPRPERAPQRR
jgi:hypothetical protein